MIQNFIYTEKNGIKTLINILKIDNNFFYIRLDVKGKKFEYKQDLVLRDINFQYNGFKININFKKDSIEINIKKLMFSITFKLLKAINKKVFLKFDGKLGFLINKLLIPIFLKLNLYENLEIKDDILILSLDNIIKNLELEKFDINLNFIGE